MKPFRKLGETRTPDGSLFALHEHDGEYFIKLNGRQLMSTTSTASELLLAQLPCNGLAARKNTRVLIGGLGLGYSLRRALDLTGPTAIVEVAELLPEIVAWNREFLRPVNGALLDDPRVRVIIGDVFEVIRNAGDASYDAILLDVDHTPASFVQAKNSRLYDRRGFALISRSLKPGGKVAFWSACEEPAFLRSLTSAGFSAQAFPAKANEHARRAIHVIYVAAHPPSTDSGCAAPQKDYTASQRSR